MGQGDLTWDVREREMREDAIGGSKEACTLAPLLGVRGRSPWAAMDLDAERKHNEPRTMKVSARRTRVVGWTRKRIGK